MTTLLEHDARDRLLKRSEVKFVFIEREEEDLANLKRELKALGPLPRNIDVLPHCGDCFQILADLVDSLQASGKLAPSFFFCDPYGFKIPGHLLRRVMQFERVELFVNIIWRELDMAISQADKPGMARVLETVFDGPRWRKAITATDIDERAEQCAQLFRTMTGAKWATYIRMLGENQRTRYFLLHLTNHAAGRDLMKDCMWRACPEGGYYVRKTDDPKQQFLIKPEPDLSPLRRWVLRKLSKGPRRWQDLIGEVRDTIWLEKHLNSVIRQLRKEKSIVADGYEGRFTRASNPRLQLASEQGAEP